jgi:hypothetical protein
VAEFDLISWHVWRENCVMNEILALVIEPMNRVTRGLCQALTMVALIGLGVWVYNVRRSISVAVK